MAISVDKRVEEARSRGRPSPVETRRITDNIIKAAREEFLTVGYDRTTFERIAQFAGTTRTAIYSRFSDKPTLFAEVFAYVSENVCSTGLMDDPVDEDLSFGQGLTLLGERLLDRAIDPRWLRLYEIGWGHCRHHPKMVASTTAIWQHYLSIAEDYFIERANCGAFAGADPRGSARLFIKLLFADIHVAVIYGRTLPHGEERADQINVVVSAFTK